MYENDILKLNKELTNHRYNMINNNKVDHQKHYNIVSELFLNSILLTDDPKYKYNIQIVNMLIKYLNKYTDYKKTDIKLMNILINLTNLELFKK